MVQGSSVTFSSDANGVPEPTFSWTKGGSALPDNDRISLSADNKQLSITNVNRTDSGKYRCVAHNSVNSVHSNAATLTVQGKHITFAGHFIPAPVTFLSSLFQLVEKTSSKNISFGIKTVPCVLQKSLGRLSNMPNTVAQNFSGFSLR